MLNIIKEQKGTALVVQFIGAVDESADLAKLEAAFAEMLGMRGRRRI